MKMILPFAVQQHLFRAYDIRGACQYFTTDFIQALGQAFATLYFSQPHKGGAQQQSKTSTVVIGYDVRLDSDTIAHRISDILAKNGLTVINLGLTTTPMMAFWAQQYDGHGIMVTASHSAKGTLGIKWLTDNLSPSSAKIQALYQQLRVYNHSYIDWHSYSSASKFANMDTLQKHSQKYASFQNSPKSQSGFLNVNLLADNSINQTTLPADIVANTYIDAIMQVFIAIRQNTQKNQRDKSSFLSQLKPKAGARLDLTIVIDCMNGATSNIAQPLFEHFCQRVIMLNDTPDGNFPTGNPDPTEPNRLAELQQTVIVNQADMGLAFDGDGDRLMVVDNSGKVILPDHLLYLLAQVAITELPLSTHTAIATETSAKNSTSKTNATKVLFDIKCSHHLPKLLSALGATPTMTRTGSSLLRQHLQVDDKHSIFAGELSGHFIFNDGYFIAYDDAMYAGLRLLHWLCNTASDFNILAPSTVDAKNSTPVITDLWGEPKALITPYKLTDITKHLPTLVSTADHYLSLQDAFSEDCSIVQQLIEFCTRLQQVIDESLDGFDNNIKGSCTSPVCQCLPNQHYTTLAQAQRLLPPETQLSCIDGLRLDFAHGFGVLRKSNTSNSLTVRFAGDTKLELKKVQARFVTLCHAFNHDLAEQIATICSE